MHARLTELYESGCDTCKAELSAEAQLGFADIVNKAAKAFARMFQRGKYHARDLKKVPEYRELVQATGNLFNGTVQDNVIPETMAKKLSNDIFYFSKLRTHAQLFEASRMLKDESGSFKPKDAFIRDVKAVNETYNKHHLTAEYYFATGSVQAAAKWAKFEEGKGRFDLQYRTASDDKVRDSHRALHNITLPPEDAFWNSYCPPNGWRCRCTVMEVRKGKYETSDSTEAAKAGERATTQIGKNGKNKLEMFRFNPGKRGVVFPPEHPYRKVQDAGDI